MMDMFEWHKKIKEVKVIDGVNLFPISWLGAKDFCEYQLYLEKFVGVEVEKTYEMILGSEVHARLEEEHLEKATEKMTILEAIEDSERTGRILTAREVSIKSLKNGIYGRIDEVTIMPDRIVIIDDKPGDKVYLGHKKQVWGYCIGFMDQFNVNKKIICSVRNRDTKEFLWVDDFDKDAMEIIRKDIQSIHDLINELRDAVPSDNVNKCMKCRFRNVCDKSLL
ncbi:MAG: Dna2/Cas4 domain-containing protein [Candidatus Aenigmatarchaeota archaeon]|nr:Dna2/Cas4 domain-containing protein [Candidatus Aenigmarchaeota archaeon]